MAMGPPRPHVECIFGPANKGVVGAVYVLKGPFCLQRPYYYLSVKDLTGKFKVVQSTRWQELTQDIEAAASLSHLSLGHAPSSICSTRSGRSRS